MEQLIQHHRHQDAATAKQRKVIRDKTYVLAVRNKITDVVMKANIWLLKLLSTSISQLTSKKNMYND